MKNKTCAIFLETIICDFWEIFLTYPTSKNIFLFHLKKMSYLHKISKFLELFNINIIYILDKKLLIKCYWIVLYVIKYF